MKILVLDSGLDPKSPIAQKTNFKGGLEFYTDNLENIKMNTSALDDTGHGTAVASIIYRLIPTAEIVPIKIVRDGTISGSDVLTHALRYIYENISCDIINISAGIVCCEDIPALREVCMRIIERGTVIVSAFDNGGAISYPAAFDNVIGIDGDIHNRDINHYEYLSGSNANFCGAKLEQRVPWLDGTKEIVSGNSFIAPHFTAWLALEFDGKDINFNKAKNHLINNCNKIIETTEYIQPKMKFKIHNAIVFPFNKEMHSLARFSDMLDFKIHGFYDVKYSCQVGRSIYELQNIENHTIIKNIDTLNWDETFDTVILGHTNTLSQSLHRNLESEIIEKCIKHGKNLFSCRDIYDKLPSQCNFEQFYCPSVPPINLTDKINIKNSKKMHVIGKPILAIVGTGSKQGKFTIQLGLRKELLNRGFSIGQLGTEPTAELFGMDCVYPMGFESSVHVRGFESVYAVNQMMGLIEQKNPDLIIVGSQAHSVPFQAGGLVEYPIPQHEFLLGVQSDAYILCVDDQSPIDYIERTVKYLESLAGGKVIAIVISPLSITYRWSTINNDMSLIKRHKIIAIKKSLSEHFENIPVLTINKRFYKILSDIVIDYFS